MSDRMIRFGVIGCGLMGREFASAAARWCHLEGLDVRPEIVAVCDPNEKAREWFDRHVSTVQQSTDDYQALLENEAVEAVYCAVPHNLHERIYVDIIAAGRHLLGEKPFGIDREANGRIMEAIGKHQAVHVSCSSEFPFYPGAMRLAELARSGAFGRIIDVEAGFWHSSDLNPKKPINWKRQTATCGEYGCLGDLGMHVVHLPLRFGWHPSRVRAFLSQIVTERPDGKGGTAACETWDNGTLLCDVESEGQAFPMTLTIKRIAPGHNNTWFIRVNGTAMSAEFNTRWAKQLWTLPYEAGGAQAWRVEDVPYASAYGAITGPIFEFGFPDAIQQMWASYCDELAHGREGMSQPLYCATPREAAASHELFTAALQSQQTGQTAAVGQA